MKKLTIEEFILKAKKKHDNKYDYSLVNYINSTTKIKILCPKHGEFKQTPNRHLAGNNCPICSNKKNNNKSFIEKAIKIHKNKYDYSLVEYVNNSTKIKILCSIHGIFEQRPSDHLFGKGCPSCAGNKKLTTEEFINRAKKIHGNKYDYSLVNYINAHTKVKIICPEHGMFEQLSNNHIKGINCPKCANNYKPTTKEFIEKAIKIHNNKYDYSLVEYVNNSTKIKILCSIHGIFEQLPNLHLQGCGCPNCFGSIKLTTEEFINRAKEIHNNKYSYDLVEYKNAHTKIKIICPEHGIFEQTPNNHFYKNGCPICNESKGEIQIRNYLIENNFEFIEQKTFKNCKYKSKLLFDFFLPKLNICIEYDGIQHFKPIKYFGGIDSLKENKIRDKIKNKYCKENDIKLIRIKYNENIEEKLWKMNLINL